MVSEEEETTGIDADREGEKQQKQKTTIPKSWTLTKQQKAFIDLFSQDDETNNE